ncbi:PH domain-containing protein [Arcanobacterium haemolyticum]|nr:PH domain-containing protein [Arcanobacterium haemolyticum]
MHKPPEPDTIWGMNLILRGEKSHFWAFLLWFFAGAILLASTINGGIAEFLFAMPLGAFIGFVGWAGWWNPRLTITDERVIVTNVVRQFSIPWEDLSEAYNRWGLYITTKSGKKIPVWALPSRVGLLQNSWRDRNKSEPDPIDWKHPRSEEMVVPLNFAADTIMILLHAVRSDPALRRRLALGVPDQKTTTFVWLPLPILGTIGLLTATIVTFAIF